MYASIVPYERTDSVSSCRRAQIELQPKSVSMLWLRYVFLHSFSYLSDA